VGERPDYNPPYDSPLEDEFAHNFVKYAAPLDAFDTQFTAETMCGRFIVDFVVRLENHVIAFECDGKDYHDESRDEWRDAMILGTGNVDTIYRLRGSDLYYHMDDCLFVISRLDPCVYSHRGLVNLETLASIEARSADYSNDPNRVLVVYWGERRGLDPLFISIDRRSRSNPTGRRQFWRHLFKYATAEGGGDLDVLMAKYRSGWSHPFPERS